MSAAESFMGHDGRECGEHRTVGPHRAWCFDCSEWCYPNIPCKGCELPKLEGERDALKAAIERVDAYLTGIEGHCSANRMDVPSWVGSMRLALAAPTGSEDKS